MNVGIAGNRAKSNTSLRQKATKPMKLKLTWR
jgi:hypothetical protein